MANITDRVHEILDQEFALQVTLARGLMNRSALCRWLIKNYDLDATVDAVDRALQSYDQDKTNEVLQAARKTFAHVHISGNTAVTLLHVRRNEETHNQLGNLFAEVDGEEEDLVRILPDRGEFLVALDRDHAEGAFEILGADNIRGPKEELRMVNLRFTGSDDPGAATAALAVSALASCDIEVRYVATGSTEQFLLLEDEDVDDAFGILHDLKQSIPGPDERG